MEEKREMFRIQSWPSIYLFIFFSSDFSLGSKWNAREKHYIITIVLCVTLLYRIQYYFEAPTGCNKSSFRCRSSPSLPCQPQNNVPWSPCDELTVSITVCCWERTLLYCITTHVLVHVQCPCPTIHNVMVACPLFSQHYSMFRMYRSSNTTSSSYNSFIFITVIQQYRLYCVRHHFHI